MSDRWYWTQPEDKTRCVEEVSGQHQCSRKRGHGPGGEYCRQHAAKKFPNWRQLPVLKRPGLVGSDNGNAKLTAEQAAEIYRRRKAGERGIKLAAEFGVSKYTVSAIVSRKMWRAATEGL